MLIEDDTQGTGQSGSFRPRNIFYAELEALRAGQSNIATQLDEVRDAMPQTAGVTEAIGSLASAVDTFRTAVADFQTSQIETNKRLVAAAERQADAVDSKIWPELCGAVMFLALGVDVDGSFNLHSHIGLFLVAAVGCEGFPNGDANYPKEPKDWQPGLQQLAPPPKANPRRLIGHDNFVANCLRLQKGQGDGFPRYCIPPAITEDDFGRFYDCAPYLLGLVQESIKCVQQSTVTTTD